jgi:hypothetical protein
MKHRSRYRAYQHKKRRVWWFDLQGFMFEYERHRLSEICAAIWKAEISIRSHYVFIFFFFFFFWGTAVGSMKAIFIDLGEQVGDSHDGSLEKYPSRLSLG